MNVCEKSNVVKKRRRPSRWDIRDCDSTIPQSTKCAVCGEWATKMLKGNLLKSTSKPNPNLSSSEFGRMFGIVFPLTFRHTNEKAKPIGSLWTHVYVCDAPKCQPNPDGYLHLKSIHDMLVVNNVESKNGDTHQLPPQFLPQIPTPFLPNTCIPDMFHGLPKLAAGPKVPKTPELKAFQARSEARISDTDSLVRLLVAHKTCPDAGQVLPMTKGPPKRGVPKNPNGSYRVTTHFDANANTPKVVVTYRSEDTIILALKKDPILADGVARGVLVFQEQPGEFFGGKPDGLQTMMQKVTENRSLLHDSPESRANLVPPLVAETQFPRIEVRRPDVEPPMVAEPLDPNNAPGRVSDYNCLFCLSDSLCPVADMTVYGSEMVTNFKNPKAPVNGMFRVCGSCLENHWVSPSGPPVFSSYRQSWIFPQTIMVPLLPHSNSLSVPIPAHP